MTKSVWFRMLSITCLCSLAWFQLPVEAYTPLTTISSRRKTFSYLYKSEQLIHGTILGSQSSVKLNEGTSSTAISMSGQQNEDKKVRVAS